MLVTFADDARWTLFHVVEMQDELAAIFGGDVDLVERRAIERSENYTRRNHILRSVETMYVA